MSRTLRFRPTAAVLAVGAVLGAGALAGCGAGQITQTDVQVSVVAGASAGVGEIAVRDAYIEFGERVQGANVYPRGGAAPLKMSIVNSGIEPDRLVSASSPAAATVAISGNAEVPPGQVLLIEGEPAAPAPPAARPVPGGGAVATPAPNEPAAPGDEIGGSGADPSQRPAAAPTPGAGAEAGSGDERTAQIVLTGLTEDVRAGLTYPVVLNFERAGQLTLNVPVGYPSEPREDEPVE